MFTAAAAVRRMLRSPQTKPEELSCQITTAGQVTGKATSSGWRPLSPSEPLQTGILLLEAKSEDTRTAPTEKLRQRFLTAGIALTAYDGGLIRASLPACLFSGHDHDLWVLRYATARSTLRRQTAMILSRLNSSRNFRAILCNIASAFPHNLPQRLLIENCICGDDLFPALDRWNPKDEGPVVQHSGFQNGFFIK